jgi:hypothetical protein
LSPKNEISEQVGLMTAVGIDVRSSLAFGRAALKGVCSLSPEAKAAVLAALDEEASAVEIDDIPGADAVTAVLVETRRWLETI